MRIYVGIIILFTIVQLQLQASSLPPKLQHFLRAHPTIVLGTSDQWDPYVIVDESGKVTGYNRDILDLVNKYTGAHFIQKTGTWSQMQKEAKEKKIDGLASLTRTKEREKWLNFSQTYVNIIKNIMTTIDSRIDKIHSLNKLKGKTIVIEKDNVLDEKLAKKLGMKIVYADTLKEMYELVIQKKYPFVFGHSAMDYFLGKFGLPRLKTVYTFNKPVELKFAVRKEFPEAIEILNYGLSQISFDEYRKLQRKWFLNPQTYLDTFLTEKEKTYLEKKKKLTLCLPNNYAPFSFIRQGKYQGICVDLAKRMSRVLYTDITFAKKECDFSTIIHEENDKFSTDPYFKQYLVLVTKKIQPYIEDINIIKGKIGVLQDTGYKEILLTQYPDLKIEIVRDIREGLRKVDKGELLGYIDLLGTAAYHLESYALTDLKVSAKLDIRIPLSFTTSEKTLAKILQKTLKKIPPEQIDNIYRKWVHVEIRQIKTFPYFKEIFLGFFFTVLASLFWIRKLSIAKTALEKSQNEIAQINASLEEKIQKELQKSKEKDLMLLHQSRLAQMGEMLSMIAHQWRQPLNVLSLQISTVKMKTLKQKIDHPTILNYTDEMMKLTRYLSRTIDDFRNFFKPEKQKTVASVDEIVEDGLKIIGTSLAQKKIEVHKEFNAGKKFPIYKNELIQVIINIFKNAEDSLLQKKSTKKYIHIRTLIKADKAFIIIADNGEGIAEDIINDIFHPYFSTKNKKNGTGLGLYMSKMIVEKHSGGKLYAANHEAGAVFTIELRIDEYSRKNET